MSVMRSIVVAFIAWVGISASAYAETKAVPTVLLFGDSIVAGYGLSANDVISVRLQNILKQKERPATVIGAGVSGDTTSGGRARLEWTLKKNNPDIVIVALGGNDVLRGLPPALTRENLDAMLGMLKARGITTILSAVQAPPSLGAQYSAEFNAIYTDMAKKYNMPLYPFLLTKVYGQPGLMQQDQIHPNVQGAKLIADDLAAYLMSNQLR